MGIRSTILLFAALMAPAAPTPAAAQAGPVDTISVGDALPRWDRLKPGTKRYLRYREENGRRIAMDIWSRTIAFEPDSSGVQRLHISQQWNGATLPFDRELDSWFELRTFRPLTHRTKRIAKDATTVAAFLFDDREVRGDPAVAGNSQAALRVAAPERTFNFETDTEMMATLPWRKGYAARINFYHPGGEPPKWYILRVTGEDRLILGGRPIDSWVVQIDYGAVGSSRFWIDKDTQSILRVAATGPDIKGTLYKVLLPDEG